MPFFPSPRQLTLPLLSFGVFFLLLRIFIHKPPPDAHALFDRIVESQIQLGIPIQLDHTLENFLSPPDTPYRSPNIDSIFTYPPPPPTNPHLAPLLKCHLKPDPSTNHTRLPHTPYISISMTPPLSLPTSNKYFNPTLLPLPSWSLAHTNATYLLVSRLVTSGLHQESHVCLANLCIPPTNNTNKTSSSHSTTQSHHCPSSILSHIKTSNLSGLLYCTTPPIPVNIPPTPSHQCTDSWTPFPHIPGFHDPRIFYSLHGEPLILINSASQYGCVGLWMQDLRPLMPALDAVLTRDGATMGPRMGWEYLTELVRHEGNKVVEKNWWVWHDGGREYVGYDLLGQWSQEKGVQGGSNTVQTRRAVENKTVDYGYEGGRTFAQMLGHGYTTPNLTSPFEPTCFDLDDNFDSLGQEGHWHQGANPLRLVLCTRDQFARGQCGASDEERMRDGRVVWFAVVHRKFVNQMELPMRYERRFVVWEGRKPFRMVGRSKWAVLVGEEVARMSGDSNKTWKNEGNGTKRTVESREGADKREVYFTYTSSLAWAWRSKNVDLQRGVSGGEDELSRLGMGYLDDEVLMGIGMDDVQQAVVKVKVEKLLQCLELCLGVAVE